MGNDELIAREHATLLAYVAGVATISLSVRPGEAVQPQLAKRLRAIRRGARHIIEHQFGDAEKAIAQLLQEGRAELRDGQIALVDGDDHADQ